MVAACLCCLSVLLCLFKKVSHQEGRSVWFFSRRLFKAACCIIKKCFHQVIISLPSCEYILFTLRLRAHPGFGLCAEIFALFHCCCFQWEGLKTCLSSGESRGNASATAGPGRAASISSPHMGQTKGAPPRWVKQGWLLHRLTAPSMFRRMPCGCTTSPCLLRARATSAAAALAQDEVIFLTVTKA